MTARRLYYRIVRRVISLRFVRYTVKRLEDIVEPVVYVCRHRNATGPLATLSKLPANIRPWAVSFFMNVDECREHLRAYTFPVTWGISPGLSKLLGGVFGGPFAQLVCGSDAIPVYRQSAKIRETFAQSVDTLAAGTSLIIFPDVEYASQGETTGALHEGFLLIDRLWHRKTGKHVQFVPINVSVKRRCLVIGRGISFRDDAPYAQEAEHVAAQLTRSLDALAAEYGV